MEARRALSLLGAALVVTWAFGCHSAGGTSGGAESTGHAGGGGAGAGRPGAGGAAATGGGGDGAVGSGGADAGGVGSGGADAGGGGAGGAISCGTSGGADAGLLHDLGFEASALGTYDCPSSNVIASPPAPWQGGECQGVGSEIVVYSSATAQAGWPAPVCGNHAAAFESADPDTQTTVARIQLHDSVQAGVDVYASYFLYAPSTLPPPIQQGQGLTLFQEWYGAPYVSGPAMPFSIFASSSAPISNGWYLRRSDPLGWPLLELPLPLDQWISIVEHVVLSPDPTAGLLEVWIDGVKQTFTSLPRTSPQISTYDTTGQSMSADHQTLHIATMTMDQKTTDFHINNYRHVNGTSKNPIGPGTITLFFDGVKIGSTYASVAPD